MALVPVFHGRVDDDGKLMLIEEERPRRQQYLRTIAGRDVDVVVKVHRNRRSDQQNKWWFGVALPLIAHELGYERSEIEALHYGLVARCFGSRFDPVLKAEVPTVRSSLMTTVQFSELMEWAVRWAAQELNIEIPLPNEAERA